MTEAIKMATGGSAAAGLHRRFILDAIRKRLSDRLPSDDECGDTKRTRLETAATQDQTVVALQHPGEAMLAKSWNPIQTSLPSYLKQDLVADRSVYQKLIDNSMSRDHSSEVPCCRPLTSLSLDGLSSLCDVTVAAAACSLLQGVGRIHCRDCLQLKAPQLCSSQGAQPGATSFLSHQISFIPPSLATISNKNGTLNSAAIPQSSVAHATGSGGKCEAHKSGGLQLMQQPASSGVISSTSSYPQPAISSLSSGFPPRLLLAGPNKLTPVASELIPPPPPLIASFGVEKHRTNGNVNTLIGLSGVIGMGVVTTSPTITSSSVPSLRISIFSSSNNNSPSQNATTSTVTSPPSTTKCTSVTMDSTIADDVTARRIRIESMTVARLRAECRRLRVPITGPKPNLVRRLMLNADAFTQTSEDNPITTTVVQTSNLSTTTTTTSSPCFVRPFQTAASLAATQPSIMAQSTPPQTALPGIGSMTLSQALALLRPLVIGSRTPLRDETRAPPVVIQSPAALSIVPANIKELCKGASVRPTVVPFTNDPIKTDLHQTVVPSDSAPPHGSSLAPANNQDPEKLSLWQSQQQLIEELRRQLENSRRAVVQARLQKPDSKVTCVDDSIVSDQRDNTPATGVAATQSPTVSNDATISSRICDTGPVTIEDDSLRSEKCGELAAENKNESYCDIADLLNECQQADVDDWNDDFQWNEIQVANDVTEAKNVDAPNSKRARKHLTVDVNALPGQPVCTFSCDLNWSNSPLDGSGFTGPQESWWDWDDFLTPGSQLAETPQTDSGSSSLSWDSDGTTFSPGPQLTPTAHNIERNLANATDSATYARRDLLLSMSSAQNPGILH